MEKHEIISLARAKLEADGYTGLYQPEVPCGCQCSDLAPCGDAELKGEYINGCLPGFKHLDPRPEHAKCGDFAVWRDREPPTAEQWDQLDYV